MLQHVEDGRYLVRSKSDPDQLYEVDLETYTCTCLDFPLICYCKHICAIQDYFEEEGPVDPPASPSVPALPALDATAPTLQDNSSKPRGLSFVAEKLERLAARLRGSRRSNSEFPSLGELEACVDTILDGTETGDILPSSQRLRPNIKSWNETKAVMPMVKGTKRRGGDDPAYGGGASSGGLAKRPRQSKKCVICDVI